MKFVLSLTLIISVNTNLNTVRGRAMPLTVTTAFADGIARPTPPKRKSHRRAQHNRRYAALRKKYRKWINKDIVYRIDPPGDTAASVSLLDAAGVKQLLARGPSPNDRPLLVNFWATWCEPCRLEFPDLVKIDADYRARGLEFVAVSTDDPGELKTGVPKFLRTMRAQMPVYILNVTDSEPVINSIDPTWGGELPATFLFDRQGKIVFQHKGRIDATALRAALDKVLSDELKTGSKFKVD